MKPTASQKSQIFRAKPCREIRRRLDTPLEAGASRFQPVGKQTRTVEIDQKIVVDNPQHLEAIASGQINCFFDKLLGGQRVPLSSVHAGIGAVRTIERTREA